MLMVIKRRFIVSNLRPVIIEASTLNLCNDIAGGLIKYFNVSMKPNGDQYGKIRMKHGAKWIIVCQFACCEKVSDVLTLFWVKYRQLTSS